MSGSGEKVEEKFEDVCSGNEEGFETVEELDSDGSLSQFVTKNTSSEKKYFKTTHTYRKNHADRLNVPLRRSKHGRQYKGKSKSRKYMKRKSCKMCSVKNQDCQEKLVDAPGKGKRCRLGGKAKAMPPVEETCDKYDSDEDAESLYFNRISLGCFQKYRDESGASTSYQDESYRSPNMLTRTGGLTGKTSEEFELLELQQWGMSSMIPYNERTKGLDTLKDIRPDKL